MWYLKGCHAQEEATYFSFLHLFNKYLSAYYVCDARDIYISLSLSLSRRKLPLLLGRQSSKQKIIVPWREYYNGLEQGSATIDHRPRPGFVLSMS